MFHNCPFVCHVTSGSSKRWTVRFLVHVYLSETSLIHGFCIFSTRIPGTWVYYPNSPRWLIFFILLLHEFHSSLQRMRFSNSNSNSDWFLLRRIPFTFFLAGWFYVSWGCSWWFLLWPVENQDSTGEHNLYLATDSEAVLFVTSITFPHLNLSFLKWNIRMYVSCSDF